SAMHSAGSVIDGTLRSRPDPRLNEFFPQQPLKTTKPTGHSGRWALCLPESNQTAYWPRPGGGLLPPNRLPPKRLPPRRLPRTRLPPVESWPVGFAFPLFGLLFAVACPPPLAGAFALGGLARMISSMVKKPSLLRSMARKVSIGLPLAFHS